MVRLTLRTGFGQHSVPEVWWCTHPWAVVCGAIYWCWGSRATTSTATGSIPPSWLMHSGHSALDPVEQVTVSLAGLDITISVRRAASPSSFSLVTSAAPSVTGPDPRVEEPEWGPFDQPVVGYPVSLEVEEQAISAETAADLAALHLPFLASARSKLRAVDREWTAAARVSRAFRAGVLAARRLEGAYLSQSSLGIPFKNSYYIALRGAGGRRGFWTTSYLEFLNQGEIASPSERVSS